MKRKKFISIALILIIFSVIIILIKKKHDLVKQYENARTEESFNIDAAYYDYMEIANQYPPAKERAKQLKKYTGFSSAYYRSEYFQKKILEDSTVLYLSIINNNTDDDEIHPRWVIRPSDTYKTTEGVFYTNKDTTMTVEGGSIVYTFTFHPDSKELEYISSNTTLSTSDNYYPEEYFDN